MEEINKLSLSRKNIHVKHSDRVNEILINIKRDGIDNLQVISDFDKTITKQHENGKPHMSSFAMFSKCPSIEEHYLIVIDELNNKYYPLELDPNISKTDKCVLMEEWWAKSEVALRGLRVSHQEMEEVCTQLAPSLRDGTKELFYILDDAKVPVLVFSAGLGDMVELVLKHCGVLFDNMKIVSNFLKYSSEGIIEGFKDTLIHVYNKNEFAIKNSEFYKLHKNRRNVVLMGDSLGDADMSEGMEDVQNVLKIGFLYERAEEALPDYLDTFDIVLVDDQTMEVPKIIIDYIKSQD